MIGFPQPSPSVEHLLQVLDSGRTYSRADIKGVPLHFVAIPTHRMPVLVHWFEPATIFERRSKRRVLAYPFLQEEFRRMRRISNHAKRAIYGRYLRRIWSRIVDQADGYHMNGDPDHTMYEFAE